MTCVDSAATNFPYAWHLYQPNNASKQIDMSSIEQARPSLGVVRPAEAAGRTPSPDAGIKSGKVHKLISVRLAGFELDKRVQKDMAPVKVQLLPQGDNGSSELTLLSGCPVVAKVKVSTALLPLLQAFHVGLP